MMGALVVPVGTLARLGPTTKILIESKNLYSFNFKMDGCSTSTPLLVSRNHVVEKLL